MLLKQLKIINNLTKNQQTSLLAHLKILTKKNPNDTEQELVIKFLEEQEYLFAINQPAFEWIKPYLEMNDFIRDLKFIFRDNLKYISYYEKQKPFREKQKQFLKMIRTKIQEEKMAKMKPTKKQISYYELLCRQHNIKTVDLSNKSRLDLKKMIADLLGE